jgi:6-pyruvoyltetrahydropterin/6-carboxytetrahydropterin synthase
MFELSQRFFFEAAHTLPREHDAPASARVHGHTYLAEVTLAGTPDPVTGMLADLALIRSELARLHDELDHHLLDTVADLGAPTLENLAALIARRLGGRLPGLSRVRVWREQTGDSCVLDARSYLLARNPSNA